MSKTYSEKLRDPRWQRKRLEVLERDGWTCQICGAENKTLNVHHMIYLGGHEPWDYQATLLQTLCESCHQAESEAKPKAVQRLLLSLAIHGAHADAINALAGYIEKAGAAGVASLEETLVALSFHADFGTFHRSLIGTYYDYGPWNEGAESTVFIPEVSLANENWEGV